LYGIYKSATGFRLKSAGMGRGAQFLVIISFLFQTTTMDHGPQRWRVFSAWPPCQCPSSIPAPLKPNPDAFFLAGFSDLIAPSQATRIRYAPRFPHLQSRQGWPRLRKWVLRNVCHSHSHFFERKRVIVFVTDTIRNQVEKGLLQVVEQQFVYRRSLRHKLWVMWRWIPCALAALQCWRLTGWMAVSPGHWYLLSLIFHVHLYRNQGRQQCRTFPAHHKYLTISIIVNKQFCTACRDVSELTLFKIWPCM